MKLGDLIIQYRKENKLSQREFSRRCGLSNSIISIIEKGVNPQTGKPSLPDMATYNKISSAMGISMQTLFTKLGNDASVQLTPTTTRIQVKGGKDKFVKAIINSGIKTPLRVNNIVHVGKVPGVKDFRYDSMMKQWEIATPKAKEEAIRYLEYLNAVKE